MSTQNKDDFDILENGIAAFEENSASKMKEFTLTFSQYMKNGLLSKDYVKIKEACRKTSQLRDEIESIGIRKNKEFYYGFICAQEDMARTLISNVEELNMIQITLEANPKLKKIVLYINEIGFATLTQLVDYLGDTTNNLWNYLNRKDIVNSNLLRKDKIGRNAVYTLTREAKQYCDKFLASTSKS
jgi:hypothetical protein